MESKVLVCLCIFDKNFWVKNKGTILFTNHFCLGWKENSLKIDQDPVETTAAPPQKKHLVGKSSFKPRTEVFSSYIIGEMLRTNELLWIRLTFAYLFLERDT